jgi:hypothetical protein
MPTPVACHHCRTEEDRWQRYLAKREYMHSLTWEMPLPRIPVGLHQSILLRLRPRGCRQILHHYPRVGHACAYAVRGYLIERTPCYNEGKCRVFLVYVFSHVWISSQISWQVAGGGLKHMKTSPILTA